MNLALRGRFLPRNLLLQAEGAERAVRCLARAAVQLAVRAQAVKFDYRGRSAPGQPPPQKSSENLLSAFLHGRVPEGRPCAHPGLPRTPSAVCGDLWRNGGFMDWAAKETSDRALHPSPRRMRPSLTAPDGATACKLWSSRWVCETATKRDAPERPSDDTEVTEQSSIPCKGCA